jgi:putative tryptophan/tyrosine transport system substrate-binding protein
MPLVRRDFLTLALAPTTVGRLPAYAQDAMRTIGFLNSASRGQLAQPLEWFHEGLREQGYVEGRNVRIDYRWADGNYADLDRYMAELIRNEVRIVVATGGAVSAKAAINATSTIPIVFVIGFDPVELGYVKGLNRPDSNVTGVSVFTTELSEKRFDLLNRLVPGSGVFALLINPGSVSTPIEIELTKAAARRSGKSIAVLEAKSDVEIDRALSAAVDQKATGLLVTADPFFNVRRSQIVSLAAQHRIPAVYPWAEYAKAGGLMSYGPELSWAYKRAGINTGRILSGAKPSELPVEQPTEFRLVVNLQTAKALALNVQSLVADETIE